MRQLILCALLGVSHAASAQSLPPASGTDPTVAEVTFRNEHVAGPAADARIAGIVADIRATAPVRLRLRAQTERRAADTDVRAGGGVAVTFRRVTLAGVAVAGSSNDILPRRDYLGELGYAQHAWATALAMRYYDFSLGSMWVVMPSYTWQATERVAVGAHYGFSTTTRPTGPREHGHTLHLRASYAPQPRVRMTLGATRGVSDFDTFTADELGRVVATTGSFAVSGNVSSATTLTGAYELQRPHAGPITQRVTIRVARRF